MVFMTYYKNWLISPEKDKNMQQGDEIRLHTFYNVHGEYIEAKWELEIKIVKNLLTQIGFQSNEKDFWRYNFIVL